MERSITMTKDGSHTISIPEMNVSYHSQHGAIQESMHVFISAGLCPLLNRQTPCINILEMGFGTGLNALLTLIGAENRDRRIHYTGIELFPLQDDEAALLNYCEQLNRKDLGPVFKNLHECDWEKDIQIAPNFTIRKLQKNIRTLPPTTQLFNLVYFDAFAPTAQPELWTREVFEKIIKMMEPGAILVTYCSKADVRRAMQAAGFMIEKIPGPWGKREMVRATRQ